MNEQREYGRKKFLIVDGTDARRAIFQQEFGDNVEILKPFPLPTSIPGAQFMNEYRRNLHHALRKRRVK